MKNETYDLASKPNKGKGKVPISIQGIVSLQYSLIARFSCLNLPEKRYTIQSVETCVRYLSTFSC